MHEEKVMDTDAPAARGYPSGAPAPLYQWGGTPVPIVARPPQSGRGKRPVSPIFNPFEGPIAGGLKEKLREPKR